MIWWRRPFMIGAKWQATLTTSRRVVNVTNLPRVMESPPKTFYKYVKPNNPWVLGDGSHGLKKWMTNDNVEFVRCVFACADCENNGLFSKEAVDMIQELQPDLTRVAAWKQIQHYVLPMNSKLSVLKKCKQKVQATTSNRTQDKYRLVWAKKVSLAAICLVAGSASFGIREN
jgi:hypothetical protein